MLKQTDRHVRETPAAAIKSLKVCSRFTISRMTSGGSSDRTLETNPMFNQKHSAYLLILLEVTREVEEEEEEEERLTRNLSNRGLM